MSAKQILFEDSARSRIGAGLDALANAVKVTLGPRGRNVLIAKSFGAPLVTKDGVTVAKEIEIDDRFANLGAQMVKEVASKTSDIAGDGTTTATVLAQAIYREGAKLVAAGANPMDLKRGIESAVEVVVSHLQRMSMPTSDKAEIAQVAIISANGDVATGTMIADAIGRVGNEGVVTIEEAQGMDTTLEVVEGMQLDRGYLSAYFVTDAEKMEVVLADAYILICEARLTSMKQLLPILEKVASEAKPLLIIAEDIEGEALATLVVNRLRGSLSVCAIKAPGYGDRRRALLQDLAALTGATAYTSDLGYDVEKATMADLGRAKRIIIDKDTTTIVDGAGDKDAIAGRARTMRRELEDTTSDYDRDKLQERLAKLVGGVAVIHVGAATEVEMKEKTARVDDAMHAVRAAVAEGIVAGGGVALIRCIPALTTLTFTDDRRFGVDIVRRAIEEPLRQIAENCGREGSVISARVSEGTGNFGYNAATDKFEDLMAAGVIDPTKVVRVALQNASSVAALMLTTEAAVAQIAEHAD